MLEKAKIKLAPYQKKHYFDWKCQDVSKSNIHNASFIMINYTLQFIPVRKRKELLTELF